MANSTSPSPVPPSARYVSAAYARREESASRETTAQGLRKTAQDACEWAMKKQTEAEVACASVFVLNKGGGGFMLVTSTQDCARKANSRS